MQGYSFGYNSFHFSEPNEVDGKAQCFFNTELMDMKLKDGTVLLSKAFENMSFDKETNTFKGSLLFGKNTWLGYD